MIRAVFSILAASVAVAYPFLIYFGITRWSARYVGLLVVAMALLLLPFRLFDRSKREHLLRVLVVPAIMLVLGGLSALLGSASFVLSLPVIISVALLATFAATLRAGAVPMIESFARLQEPQLSADEVGWCRSITVLWCYFFVINGITALLLALIAPIGWWALYTGGIAYGLMGLLFVGELVARKWRFQKFGSSLVDRMLFRLLAREGVE